MSSNLISPPVSVLGDGTSGHVLTLLAVSFRVRDMAKATPKQIALIEYLGGPSDDLSREDASAWIAAAMKDPQYEARRRDWNRVKLDLHPDLFEKELAERIANWKPGRWEALYNESFDSFGLISKKLNKAVSKQAVDLLDQFQPGWDSEWSMDPLQVVDVLYGDFAEAVESIDPKFISEPHRRGSANRFLNLTIPTNTQNPMITITRDGESYGPYDTATIETMLTAGQVALSDLAWRDGEADWRPLGELIGRTAPVSVPPPLPQAAAPLEDEVLLNEMGVMVTRKQIAIGGNTFVARNVGGVSIERIEPRRVFPTLGFLIFGMMLIGSFATFNSTGEAGQGAGVFMIIVFGGLTLVCGLRAFKRAQFTIALAAAGGMQKAFTSPDQKFVERVAAAIQQAIL